MTRNWRERVGEWLAEERAGSDLQAEETLRGVFQALGSPAVSADFARAVLRRIQPIPAPVEMPAWMKVAIAFLLVATAISVAYLPLALMAFTATFEFGSLIELANTAVVQSSRLFAAWLSMWQATAELNRALIRVASTPQVSLFLLAVTGLAAVSFRLVARLTVSKRSSQHA
jgi:hypothetical protein